MTGTQLAADIRKRTGTSSTTLPDSVLLPVVNYVKDLIATMITEKDENYFILPAYFDLVASTATAREYSWPDDLLNNIVSLQLCLGGGTAPLPYVYATKTSFANAQRATGGLTEENIIAAYNNNNPSYIQYRRSIYILSWTITALSQGGLLWYRSYPADLANLTGTTGLEVDPTTTTFGVPRQFHELWAIRTSIEIKQNRTRPIPLSELEEKWEQSMQERLDELRRTNLSGEELGMFPDTSREGQNGQNL